MHINQAITKVEIEYREASKKFSPFSSPHEGIGIIREEYMELEKEVFKQFSKRDKRRMTKEALHLATMAIRFLADLC